MGPSGCAALVVREAGKGPAACNTAATASPSRLCTRCLHRGQQMVHIHVVHPFRRPVEMQRVYTRRWASTALWRRFFGCALSSPHLLIPFGCWWWYSHLHHSSGTCPPLCCADVRRKRRCKTFCLVRKRAPKQVVGEVLTSVACRTCTLHHTIAHTQTHTHRHTHSRTHTHIHTHAPTHTYTHHHTPKHTHTHTHTHVHTQHTLTHTLTPSHTHTHTKHTFCCGGECRVAACWVHVASPLGGRGACARDANHYGDVRRRGLFREEEGWCRGGMVNRPTFPPTHTCLSLLHRAQLGAADANLISPIQTSRLCTFALWSHQPRRPRRRPKETRQFVDAAWCRSPESDAARPAPTMRGCLSL